MAKDLSAEVIGVFPDRVRISVDDLEDYQIAEERLKVGSYLRISDNDNAVMIASIESFSIEAGEDRDGEPIRRYLLDASPLGVIKDGRFERGGDALAIPPKGVEPATIDDIRKIFEETIPEESRLRFAALASDTGVSVPVDGDKFFGKHIAVVGSTGSGKSHSVATIIQRAVDGKQGEYDGLNNSHIVIFDIHSEYRAAFPDANLVDIANLRLPYWLLNSEELQELFIDTEANDHNQRNVFKEAVITSKREHFDGTPAQRDRIHLDSPVAFDIREVLDFVREKDAEMVAGSSNKLVKGPLNGKLSNFVSRLENKLDDRRLDFLLGKEAEKMTFEGVLRQLIGYGEHKSNVTILDLSGVPFDVLSITVSLISRVLFEYGYYYKRMRAEQTGNANAINDVPLLLVYEEAHKYVPNDGSAKYRASRESIERIAKEGRKYGVTLLLASQRPSEISETIFSQCNNFLALRLTNPTDQNYVKRLLPDAMGGMVDRMPMLRVGESLLIGDATAIPAIVRIDMCNPAPASSDTPYWEYWQDPWKNLDIPGIREVWGSR